MKIFPLDKTLAEGDLLLLCFFFLVAVVKTGGGEVMSKRIGSRREE